MNKFLKFSLLLVIGLPLLAVLGIALFIQFQDANRFKPTIEQQAIEQAGINLSIDGSLTWSLYPLGIDINDMQISDQHGQAFASIKRILAQVDLFSLLKGSPSVHTLLLDSAKISLFEDAQGKANWLNILPTQETAALEKDTSETKAKDSNQDSKNQKTSELSFLLSQLSISNLNIAYTSELKNQSIKLSPASIKVSNIAPNKDVPFDIDFTFEDTIEKLTLNSNIIGLIEFSPDFSKITVKELKSNFEANGAFSQFEVINASLDSKFTVNTSKEEIVVEELFLILEELKLDSQLSLTNYLESPHLQGQVQVNKFNPKILAERFGIALPTLSSPEALNAFSLSSKLEFKDQALYFQQINTQVDKSSWQGDLTFNSSNQAFALSLVGDSVNIDNYLPAEEENNNTQASANDEAPTNNQTNSELLPLETLRQLDLDISLKQQSLIANKVLIENLNVELAAKNGIVSVTNLSAKSHEGILNTSAKIDARSNKPTWQADTKISNLNLGTLIQALEIQNAEDSASLSGTLNFSAALTSRGNTLSEVQSNALAQSEFEVLDGEVQGINFKALSCKGLALINKDSIDTNNWPKATPFDLLKGSASLKDEILTNNFELTSSGLAMSAEGPINLSATSLDIKTGLRVIGDSNEHACRVNEKFKDIPVPVRCKGKFDTPPAELCKLDSKRLLDATKQVAAKEAKRKLDKELDRALNKHLGDKDEIKDAAKNLLKKLF
ncbi:hypothetical protein A3740_14630 [Oleiphilus sp. HI0068]|jgi:uncharacterized protein involved in outer membrane biogenesis|nr:hypothetical protein A3740_14630 [Oleiphilus sp. HI0068]KZY80749.1 hypothetical protein A3741_00625 [Oleiphilus sp. HI0069]